MAIKTTKDGSHTVIHQHLNEAYHSVHGALQESKHVFIQHGLVSFQQQDTVRVFEMGFGTGLNALLSYQFAQSNEINIQYSSIEAYPLEIAIVKDLNYSSLVGDKELFEKMHQVSWDETHHLSDNFILHKIRGEIENTSLEFLKPVDVIFFDAFAPEAQAHLWQPSILRKMFDILKVGGRLSTYCAKGQFKRDLKAVGFKVENVQGPPGKREMTIGIKI